VPSPGEDTTLVVTDIMCVVRACIRVRACACVCVRVRVRVRVRVCVCVRARISAYCARAHTTAHLSNMQGVHRALGVPGAGRHGVRGRYAQRSRAQGSEEVERVRAGDGGRLVPACVPRSQVGGSVTACR
jgi:hypothetical protein